MIDPQVLPFDTISVASDARCALALTWDSRKVDTQTAFVALAGESTHGNQFIQAALDAGAPFALTNLDVPRAIRVSDANQALLLWAKHERKKSPLVIGMTGTAGKTTTKSYVAAALEALYMPVFNTIPAIACFLIEHSASNKPLVIEMGIDRIGEMAELMDLIQPDVGIITSIGAAHLEQLGSIQQVATEKGLLLQASSALVSEQAAVFYPSQESYGFGDASYAGTLLQIDESGVRFSWESKEYFLPRASRVQAEAALVALVLAQRYGSMKDVAERLAAVEVPSGRYEVLSGLWTVINDTYNASPLSVKASLEALSQYSGRKISVLGRMLELGEHERELHADVGQVARQHADLTYGVGKYATELGEHAYATVPELLTDLLSQVRAGDVILVKASRGISLSPSERLQWGVGLESVVQALVLAQD